MRALNRVLLNSLPLPISKILLYARAKHGRTCVLFAIALLACRLGARLCAPKLIINSHCRQRKRERERESGLARRAMTTKARVQQSTVSSCLWKECTASRSPSRTRTRVGREHNEPTHAQSTPPQVHTHSTPPTKRQQPKLSNGTNLAYPSTRAAAANTGLAATSSPAPDDPYQ